jgi:hypothetical protein
MYTIGEFGPEGLFLRHIKQLWVHLIVNLELRVYLFGRQFRILQTKITETIQVHNSKLMKDITVDSVH